MRYCNARLLVARHLVGRSHLCVVHCVSGMTAGCPHRAGCLDMLTPADEFAICVFHENQQWFDPQNAMARIQEDMHREGPGGTGRNNVIPPPVQCLLQATPHNLGQAKVRVSWCH